MFDKRLSRVSLKTTFGVYASGFRFKEVYFPRIKVKFIRKGSEYVVFLFSPPARKNMRHVSWAFRNIAFQLVPGRTDAGI